MAKLPLKSDTAPPPAGRAVARAMPVFQGHTPLDPGEVIKTDKLTPLEREQLAKLGVKAGEALPADLPQRLADAQAAARRDAESPTDLPVDPKTPPIQIKPIDIGELSPEKQRELMDSLQSFQQIHQHFENTPQVAAAGAGVNAALRTAHNAALEPQASQVAAPQSVDPRPIVTPEPAATVADTGTDPVKLCAHCLHDPRQADTVEVTHDDKLRFFQAVLGGQRFTKQYTLLAGNVRVTFRSLLSTETTTVLAQLGRDVRSQKILSDGDYEQWRLYYRMGLSLQDIAVGGTLTSVPELSALQAPVELGATRVGEIWEYVETDVLPQESLKRQVGRLFMDFQRVVEKLEVMMDAPENSDFWQGIGSPR